MQEAMENGFAFKNTTTNCIFQESGNLWGGLWLDSQCREATAEGDMKWESTRDSGREEIQGYVSLYRPLINQ